VAKYVAEQSNELGAATVGRDLALLHAIFKSAIKEELVESNPADSAERPKLPRRKWRILEPVEVARVYKAFVDEQARTAFLTLVLTGARRSELLALRWRDVDLVENVLRVRDSKTEEGVRSIAISSKLAEALWQHRRRSRFQGDDERVFCHPERGTIYRAETFQDEFNAALKLAGINDRMRPFHDLRHTSITNDAAAGANPVALMTKAAHANMSTTKTYLHVAGVVFRDEAERLEARLLGAGDDAKTASESLDDQNFYPSFYPPRRVEATLDDLRRSRERLAKPGDVLSANQLF
jgi:integrase